MDGLADQFEFPIDFKGQEKADKLAIILVYSSVVIALLAGLLTQNLTILFGVYAGSLIVTLAIVVPPYPFYKQNPPQWLQVKYEL